jgi:O-antigen biosynthesis protein WbqP
MNEIAIYEERHYVGLDAIPGMTGWCQVNLQESGTLDQMADLDYEYVRKQSLLWDIKILVLTIPTLVFRRSTH